MKSKELRYYLTASEKVPFMQWFSSLKDVTTRARILRRLERFELGHYGDYKPLGDGIYELRLAFGPGYRVYFGEKDHLTVILLLGGDKSSQSKDVKIAKQYWQEFLGVNNA